MNVYEIESLARAAAVLINTMGTHLASRAGGTADKLLGRIDSELAGVETEEELRTLQISNNIKQANLNLLAGRLIAFLGEWRDDGNHPAYQESERQLMELAESLIQEDPSTTESAVN